MSQNLLSSFGLPEDRVIKAIETLQQGGGVLVVDDESRENEGDLIFPAHSITLEQMALLIRECSGIVCLCLTAEKAATLELQPMVKQNTSVHGTAFTNSIEAAEGVTTGVSAADRVATIRAAVAENALPSDLHSPGHIFPLVARPGGVIERPGHTEATVDLMKLAGLPQCGVLCELTNADGSMARLPRIKEFALEHGFPILSVEDIATFRHERERRRPLPKITPVDAQSSA